MYRLFVGIGLITLLGFITVWQQITAVRQGYNISSIAKAKEQLLNEQKILKLKLTSMKSPQHLLMVEQSGEVKLSSPEILTLNEVHNRISNYYQNAHEVGLLPLR